MTWSPRWRRCDGVLLRRRRRGRERAPRRFRDAFAPRRASRSFPFISKTMNCNFISLATRVMLGQNAKPFQITTMDIDYV